MQPGPIYKTKKMNMQFEKMEMKMMKMKFISSIDNFIEVALCVADRIVDSVLLHMHFMMHFGISSIVSSHFASRNALYAINRSVDSLIIFNVIVMRLKKNLVIVFPSTKIVRDTIDFCSNESSIMKMIKMKKNCSFFQKFDDRNVKK